MTMTKKYHSNPSDNRAKIKAISDQLVSRISDLLDYFEIEYEFFDNRVSFACPIHQGDNTTALNIFISGDYAKGNWQCWTHHCESRYKQDILGFLQGLLSSRKDEEVGFGETLKFACKFLDSLLMIYKFQKKMINNSLSNSLTKYLKNTQTTLKASPEQK